MSATQFSLKHIGFGVALFAAVLGLLATAAPSARAQTEIVLHSFMGMPDGNGPHGRLVRDSKGNFYGTTVAGGSNYGVVFKLTSTGKEKVFYSFTGTPDGENSYAGLIRDAAGNFYGTTLGGGNAPCSYEKNIGCGTVFKLDSASTETVLHSFAGPPDGYAPRGGLIRDAQGNLYGTTSFGGAYGNNGTVFKLDSAGTETVLHSFTGSLDGAYPLADLIRDAQGNLYGTTDLGGVSGYGSVFKLDSTGSLTVLHSFAGGADGANPSSGMINDPQGNLYGTTYAGGVYSYGTVFKLTPTGVETVLYSFAGNPDGSNPSGGLVRDAQGNLYGTTSFGGAYYYGTVFKLTPNRTETVLYSFTSGNDGGLPYAPLIRDKQGNLYGTTNVGGTYNYGTVFEVIP
jgi:uncharacterized repeat protein (TIGR03803 family)